MKIEVKLIQIFIACETAKQYSVFIRFARRAYSRCDISGWIYYFWVGEVIIKVDKLSPI